MHNPEPKLLSDSIQLADGIACLDGFFSESEADAAFAALVDEISWRQHTIQLFGREVREPRLTSWHGDPGTRYRYSNRTRVPKPWTPALETVHQAVSDRAGVRFNSVLVNRYRDGQDSMGWHSDDEPELGEAPVIASVSLGAERRFLLRERTSRRKVTEVTLRHGSLLLMYADSQQRYQHSIPKTVKPVGERINLTFRNVAVDSTGDNVAREGHSRARPGSGSVAEG